MVALLDDLQDEIGNALADSGLFSDAVLTRDTPVVGTDSFDPVAPVSTTYACKALVETYSERFRLDGLVEQNDRKVLVLANGLAVQPKAGDRITISGITFAVIDVGTDPAQAVWEIQGRM